MSDCPNCGGPFFANFVRRFTEPVNAVGGWGRAGSGKETPPRTEYQDGRECRKCRTFYPFSEAQ